MNETQSENIVPLPAPVSASPSPPVPSLTLVLTADEANALSNLLDGAVKAHGIPAAVAAVPLFHKLRQAAQAAGFPTA